MKCSFFDKRQQVLTLAVAICGMLTACGLRAGEVPAGYSLKVETNLGLAVGNYNLALDNDGNIFVTDSSQVRIFSPKTGSVIAEISGLEDARAAAIGDDRAFIAERRPNRLIVVDKRTLAKLFEVSVGEGPEMVIFDRSSKRAFTLNEGSNDVTAVDANSGTRIGTVPLEGKPRAAASDGKGMVFVNLSDKDEVAGFDAVTLQVRFRSSLPSCSHPNGMSVDVAHWLIFSACENGVIAVSGMYNGRSVATIATAAQTTDVNYDSIMKQIFALGQLGTVTVAREINPKRFSVLGDLSAGACGLSMQQDEDRHRLFIIVADQRAPGDCRLAKQSAGDHKLLEFGL